ncbi:MAG: glycosyltransferase [Leptolyngbyaceae cyanobacterium CSU_1_3]|nr:glycosyltransferase [Leptolyngbyaceae cyanobacterium CSU_1_3]
MNQRSDRGDHTSTLCISVVIPTADRPQTIGPAIQKIFANTVQPYEVIVIDQSRTDRTLKALSSFIQAGKITYLQDTGLGVSRARNVGWRKASGEIIAFTDDDAHTDLHWLENVRQTFERSDLNIGVLGGKIIPFYEQKNPDWSIPKRWEYLLPAYDQGDTLSLYEGTSLPAGVNYSIYRSLLEKFDGFDEDLGPNLSRNLQIYGEDADLARRISQNGFSLVYNPNCVVYHPVPLSRQNQNFLNKRLISEGATFAFMQIKSSNLGKDLVSLSKSFIRYSNFVLQGKDTDELYYLRGKILVLLKCGLFKQPPNSL